MPGALRALFDEAAFRFRAFGGSAPKLAQSAAPEHAICRDMNRLLPPFRVRVEKLLTVMRGDGFDPTVFETWRSPERAAWLATQGTGIVKSMHCYGVACDIVSASKLWSAPVSFWVSLRDNAEALGLTSGARFSKVDLDHVQGVPVGRQWFVRAASAQELAEFVAEELPIPATAAPPVPAG